MNCIRCLCLFYWLALTVGLLHPKGGAVAGLVIGPVGEYCNLAHFGAFVVLAVLVRGARLRSRLLPSAIGLSAYAVVTEAAQLVIPGRSANLADGLANVLGIAAGMVIWRLGVEIRSRRHGRRQERVR